MYSTCSRMEMEMFFFLQKAETHSLLDLFTLLYINQTLLRLNILVTTVVDGLFRVQFRVRDQSGGQSARLHPGGSHQHHRYHRYVHMAAHTKQSNW